MLSIGASTLSKSCSTKARNRRWCDAISASEYRYGLPCRSTTSGGIGARLIQVDQQVLEDARGQDAVVHRGAVDGQLVVEEDHVDGRAERDRVGLEAGVAADVVGSIPLVTKCAGEFELSRGDQFTARAPGDVAQPDRQHVGHHAAGGLDLRGGTAGHRQRHDDVVGVGHPRQESAERRRHEDCQRTVELDGQGFESSLLRDRQIAAGDHIVEGKRGGGAGTVCEGHPLREVRHPRQPVLAVGLAAAAGLVASS